jgi:hypothetical protein
MHLFGGLGKNTHFSTYAIGFDSTPPVITGTIKGAVNANGWYNKDVTVHFEATDSVSGIDTVTSDMTLRNEGADQSVKGTATDKAGNSSSTNVSGVNIDKTAPALTIDTPQNFSVLQYGTALKFSASDSLSGIDSIVGHLTSWNGVSNIKSGYIPKPGVYNITIEAKDLAGNLTAETKQFVVYDPTGEFVTGGGWINSPEGAYVKDKELYGKATFSFESKYKKGANVPTGNIEFQLKAGNFNFKSTNYDWLVISGAKIQYKGSGTINGQGDYRFILTAIDGQIKAKDEPDRFRIKIWDKSTNEIVYDNQIGSDESADLSKESTVLSGGSIVIHKDK